MPSAFHICVSLLARLAVVTEAARPRNACSLEQKVSAPVKVSLLEPEYERYLFVDPKSDNLHVMMPIVSGDEFGLDNTCQFMKEITEFVGKKNPKIPPALDRLKKYRDALDVDIWFLEQVVAERKEDAFLSNFKDAKVKRLKQVDSYIEVLEPTIATWTAPKSWESHMPGELVETIRLSKNLLSMVLYPTQGIDVFLRLKGPSAGCFLAQRLYKCKFSWGLHYKILNVTRSSNVAGAMWKSEITTAASALKNYVFKGDFARDTIATQELYEEMQRRTKDYFTSRGKENPTFKYPILQNLMDTVMIDELNMDEAWEYIMSVDFPSGLDDVFPSKASFLTLALRKVLMPLPAGSKLARFDKQAGEAGAVVQAFLGLLNLHYKAYFCNKSDGAKKSHVCGNLWDLLEVEEGMQTRVEQIWDALNTPDEDPEDALMQWAREKYFQVALKDPPGNLTLSHTFKRRFEAFWKTVQDAPHLDEWLFHFKDLPGLGVTHHNTISVDFADLFIRHKESLAPAIDIANETMQTLRYLAQSFKDRLSNFADHLPNKNPGVRQSVTVEEDWLKRLASAADPKRAAHMLLLSANAKS